MPRPDEQQQPGSCSAPGCGCGPSSTTRREVFQLLGGAGLAAAVATVARPWQAMAGPFTRDDFAGLVPVDKKLRPEWLKSLRERGQPEVWKGEQLRFLGMPIGGIGCGQLYLAGDGRLWFWDIFRPQPKPADGGSIYAGLHYEFPIDSLAGPNPPGPDTRPPKGEAPVSQGFAVQVRQSGQAAVSRTLDATGFPEISFRGEYPVARITYRDPALPVEVDLEAFSPFIPLDLDSSSLPATIFRFKARNKSQQPVEVSLAGWLENAACRYGDGGWSLSRLARVERQKGRATVAGSVVVNEDDLARPRRADRLLEDWSKPTYEGWTVEGAAFGSGPLDRGQIRDYQGNVGGPGDRLVNSHTSAPGDDVSSRDAATGKLTSQPFTLDRRFLSFWIGGGSHQGQTCLNLMVDGQVVRSATGRDENRMSRHSFDLRDLQGKQGTFEIVDAATGAWGNIGVGPITLTDRPLAENPEDVPGYGSMALTLLTSEPGVVKAFADLAGPTDPAQLFAKLAQGGPQQATCRLDQKQVSALAGTATLPPGGEATFDFVLTWFFPYYGPPESAMGAITDLASLRRQYASRFSNASDVAAQVADDFERLADHTRLWNHAWYDSTLPYWLLDRSFITVDCLATQTLHGFDNGRWWGWEGVDCCPGTCQHVWQYAQGAAYLFPELERSFREKVDFDLAWHDTGAMDYRAENARQVAHDGFCGTLLRVYREHRMSGDHAFLERLWPRVKLSLQYLMAEDKNADGLLEGVQYNTLDAAWEGPMGWISSLYLAALAAGAEMAREAGDNAFAMRCQERVERGRRALVSTLYDGEYFIHVPPDFNRTNTNKGCHIDQVFGQSFAWTVNLPRVVPEPECRSALKALWKYNFSPDVGPFRENSPIQGGRWYAMPGEAGLLMCTWPKGGASDAPGGGNSTFVGYFNECMNGFEYQVAAHMVWEARRDDGTIDQDLLEHGLAITRAIHDRYGAEKRNPFNEVECSDHYSRSMASYAVFLAVCGFEHHGPDAHLGFSPRLSPDDFRAPFTAAGAWGNIGQRRQTGRQIDYVEPRHGRLRLCTLAFDLPEARDPREVAVTIRGLPLPSGFTREGRRLLVRLTRETLLAENTRLEVKITTG